VRAPRTASLALLVLALTALAAPISAAARAPRPNVVVITTDDQPLSMMDRRALPSTHELLVDGGTSFSNAIVTTPLCCPSRASLLTGQYGHNNGFLKNNYADLINRRNVLPAWLQAAGYRTAHVGRYLNGFENKVGGTHRAAPGWDVWQTELAPRRYFDYELSANGKPRHLGTDDDDYLTRVLNDKSAALASRLAARRRPFYLQIDHLAPHKGGGRASSACRDAALPDPSDAAAFAGEPLPPSPSFDEADVGDKPSPIRSLPPLGEEQPSRLAEQYRCGLASLLAVDRGVEATYEAVRRAGELDRTAFAFTSDNGYYYGEHRLRDAKHYPYEEGLRVPLAIRVPARYRGGAPRVAESDAPVANIDLAPTILDLAGVDPCRAPGRCRTMDGRSLLRLTRDPGASWPANRGLAIEIALTASSGTGVCAYQGIRTPDRLYLRHESAVNPLTGACEGIDEVEHYDLAADPYQLQNLYPAPLGSAAGSLEQRLSARLAALRDCAGIRGRDPKPRTGRYCE
jgi:arylsulfatase A-like enzyme